jgi:hypothetical protein
MRLPVRTLLPYALAAAVASVISAVIARHVGQGIIGQTVSASHLLLVLTLYAVAGGRSAMAGASAWIGGLFTAALDAAIGHGLAFAISPPPTDPAAYVGMLGRTPAAEEIPALQAQAAAAEVLFVLVIGVLAGAIGGWVARRRGLVAVRS